MAIGDLARVSLVYRNVVRGDQAVNTFGFKAISAGATLTNLSTAFKTALVKNTSGGILYPLSSNAETTSLFVRDVQPGTAAEVENDYPAVLGAIAGDPLPPQVAAVITWRTGLAGRSFRGRTYLPFIDESTSSDGTVSAPQITRMETVITQMLTVFGPSGSDANWQFVIISEEAAGAPRVPKVGSAVTAGLARPILYTQRRRNN